MLEEKKLENKLNLNLKFSSELKNFLDVNFDDIFSDAITATDLDLADDDGDILEFETDDNGYINVMVNDEKVRNKIAASILQDKIETQLFLIEHEKSRNTIVEGYI